jgi:hypothetical protein
MIQDKIFVIGLNKTGTTSLHILFLVNGLKSYHNPDWIRRIKDDHDYEINGFQCFSDGRAENFTDMAEKYANAIFILSTRSLRSWIISRFKHGYVTLNASFRTPEQRGKFNWAYPPSKEKMISWIEARNTHHHNVLTYFKNNPERLYIINIEKLGWERFIGEKLGFKKTNIKAINVIKKQDVSIMSEIEALVDKTFLELGYDQAQIDEYLIKNRSDYSRIYKNNFEC